MRKLLEFISIQTEKKPRRFLLIGILLLNIIFFFVSTYVISLFPVSGSKNLGFIQGAYYTVTMILDSGSFGTVIQEIGASGVLTIFICLSIILIGMILFTGALIGYITTWISDFIKSADGGERRLLLSDHIVIINWNKLALTFFRDLLFRKGNHVVVLLVDSDTKSVEKEIEETIRKTIKEWNRRKKILRNNISVIVRDGTALTEKQFKEICLESAGGIVVLDNEKEYYRQSEQSDFGRENPNTIKCLLQIFEYLDTDLWWRKSHIIVETRTRKTADLVNYIRMQHTLAVRVPTTPILASLMMGQFLSLYSIMPQLIDVYHWLLSAQCSASVYSRPIDDESGKDSMFGIQYCDTHTEGIPLSSVHYDERNFCFLADSNHAFERTAETSDHHFEPDIRPESLFQSSYRIVIFGHSSSIHLILDNYAKYTANSRLFTDNSSPLEVIIIDDAAAIKKNGYYQNYDFVKQIIETDKYSQESLILQIEEVILQYPGTVNILLLSNDMADDQNVDAEVICNSVLICEAVKEMLDKRLLDYDYGNDVYYDSANNDIGTPKINIITDLIDLKSVFFHLYDYNAKVVIENLYLCSLMNMLIHNGSSTYQFFADTVLNNLLFSFKDGSKSISVVEASRFFRTLPPKCSAHELIRSVLNQSAEENKLPCVIIGYFDRLHFNIFSGDLSSITVELKPDDQLIVYSYLDES